MYPIKVITFVFKLRTYFNELIKNHNNLMMETYIDIQIKE